MLEWTDPPFSAGHWVPDLARLGGGAPLLANPGGDSQRLSWGEISAAAADVVLVAPCGYHLERSTEIAKTAVAEGALPRGAEVWAVDADAYFVRPGPRIIAGAEIVSRILHPDRVGEVSAVHAVRVVQLDICTIDHHQVARTVGIVDYTHAAKAGAFEARATTPCWRQTARRRPATTSGAARTPRRQGTRESFRCRVLCRGAPDHR